MELPTITRKALAKVHPDYRTAEHPSGTVSILMLDPQQVTVLQRHRIVD